MIFAFFLFFNHRMHHDANRKTERTERRGPGPGRAEWRGEFHAQFAIPNLSRSPRADIKANPIAILSPSQHVDPFSPSFAWSLVASQGAPMCV